MEILPTQFQEFPGGVETVMSDMLRRGFVCRGNAA